MAEILTLDNGVTLVVEPRASSLTAAVGVYVRAGSAYEHPEQNGLAHLIEHLAFRETTHRTGQAIACAIDDLGGDVNAYTGKEYTAYHARVLPDQVDPALDLLSDLVLHPTFAERDLAHERNIILEEIRLLDDTPDELVHDLLEAEIYRDHALGAMIVGTAENIAGFVEADVWSFYNSFYRGEHLVVTAAGRVQPDRFFALGKELFGDVPSRGRRAEFKTPTLARGLSIRDRGYGELHLALGGPAMALSDPRVYAFYLLVCILGGGASSRLFQRLREEDGVSYAIWAYDALYATTGIFGVYLDLPPESLTPAYDAVREELDRLMRTPPSADELQRAKRQLLTGHTLGLETPYHRMERNATSLMLLGRIPHMGEIARGFSAVEPEDVHSLAADMLPPDRLSLAAIGPWPGGIPVEDFS